MWQPTDKKRKKHTQHNFLFNLYIIPLLSSCLSGFYFPRLSIDSVGFQHACRTVGESFGQWVQLKRQKKSRRSGSIRYNIQLLEVFLRTQYGIKRDPPILPGAAQKEECYWEREEKGEEAETPTLFSTRFLSSSHVMFFFFLPSFIPHPESTRTHYKHMTQLRTSSKWIQTQHDQMRQWSPIDLRVTAEGGGAADNVLSLWRQTVSGVAMVKSELWCPLPKHPRWMKRWASARLSVFPLFTVVFTQSSEWFLSYRCVSVLRNDSMGSSEGGERQSRRKEECGLMETSMNSISLQTGCGDPEIFLKYPSTVCALCYTLIARLCENEGTVCDSPIWRGLFIVCVCVLHKTSARYLLGRTQ